MISRYADKRVDEIFSDKEKLRRWDTTELAVIQARSHFGTTADSTFVTIRDALAANPPDIAWWKAKDAELRHDLNAYLEERRRYIPIELQPEFHRDMTSYDTEESAFARSLLICSELVELEVRTYIHALRRLAHNHRYTLLLDRTHGQSAKLRTFGGRVATWAAELRMPLLMLKTARGFCSYSRLSGAVGNYGGNMSPQLEMKALEILGMKPFYGATQIIPRTVYAPLAQSLQLICEGINKAALDIRLGARSGTPIVQEPFRKSQMGSSAMPHKKNTITTEQMEGMVRMARTKTLAISSNCQTWEGRAIEQSCVERVEWPDLFHVTLRMLTAMTEIIDNLQVFPDNMLREIRDSCGTYASDEAKNFLADALAQQDIPTKTTYRIIQLAAFNALGPSPAERDMRMELPKRPSEATKMLNRIEASSRKRPSIETIIAEASLVPIAELEATGDEIAEWNAHLRRLFSSSEVKASWNAVFDPETLTANEDFLITVVFSDL